MTLLVYMKDEWEQDEGDRLRVLYNGKDYEPFALEVPPTLGGRFALDARDGMAKDCDIAVAEGSHGRAQRTRLT